MLQKVVLFVVMALSITLFEYIAGLIFIKGMKIKLWDYSSCWGNIQGIVYPTYTFFWYLLSAFYYFLVHPEILDWLYWFTNHIEFSFVIGFFYGIFTVDLLHTFNIMTKVRAFARDKDVVVKLEKLQHQIRAFNEERKEKVHFWLSMKTTNISLPEGLNKIFEKKK